MGKIIQPVTTAEIQANDGLAELGLGDRAMRTVITELETKDLLETWIESNGEEGRLKQVRITSDPRRVHEAFQPSVDASDVLSADED